MFKRITWMGIGMAVGATGAFRAKRKMEETIERYLPEQVADRAVTSARGVSQVVKAAATEGREVMRATETEPLVRVTFEPDEFRRDRVAVQLRRWPGGSGTLLAHADYHGRWVQPLP